MTKEEINDLSTYFKLAIYRDEGNLLLEEYEELNDIIKRNKYAKLQEEARYKWITGKISDEVYQTIYHMYDDIIFNKSYEKH